ncbi:MAG: ATP-binding protein [Dehalococcoidia bacterium]
MSIHLLLPLATMALNLGLVGLVLTHPWRVPGKRVFVVFLFTNAFWAGAQYGINASSDVASAQLWHTLLLVNAMLFPVLFLHFSYKFADVEPRRAVLIGAYAVGFSAVALSLAGMMTSGMVQQGTRFVPQVTPLFIATASVLYGLGLLAIVNVVRAIGRSVGPASRNRATYLLAGILIALGLGTVDFLWVLGFTGLFSETAGNLAFGLLATAALLQERLMDIRRAMRATVSYTLLGVPAVGLGVAAATFGPDAEEPTVLWALVGALAGYTALAPRFYAKIRSWVDQAWFRERYQPLGQLRRFTSDVRTIHDMQLQAVTLVNVVRKATGARHVSLIRRTPGSERLTSDASVGTDAHLELTFANDDVLAVQLSNAGGAITLEELRASAGWPSLPPQQRSGLTSAGIELLVPVQFKGRLEGLLALGPRQDHSPYTLEQSEHLSAVASEVAPSMENARLYEELRLQLQELKETQAHLVQTGRLTALGSLATGVAHEISNPLFSIIGRAELLSADLDSHTKSGKATEYVSVISQMARRISTVVNGLISFSRRQEEHEPVDLNLLVSETVGLIEHDFELADITMHQELAAGDMTIKANGARLRDALMHLMLNARDAMPDGGTLTISTTGTHAGVRLTCSDSGCGIADEHLPKIFDAFYTTKEGGTGAGLGLYVCRAVVDEHNGTIQVKTAEERGTSVTMHLPYQPGSGVPLEPVASGAPDGAGE